MELPRAELLVLGPDGSLLGTSACPERASASAGFRRRTTSHSSPIPELLVTRSAHCTLERDGGRWVVVDGGSVNGTYVRRAGELERVAEPVVLRDGDVVCILGSLSKAGDRRFFELAFEETADSQATRAVDLDRPAACLSYDTSEARLVLVRGAERQEIQVRAQAHRLVSYMAERNADAGGSPALCTHEELMEAVWEGEPMHTRMELAKLVWELRRKLEPFGAAELIESERRRGYRLRTCP